MDTIDYVDEVEWLTLLMTAKGVARIWVLNCPHELEAVTLALEQAEAQKRSLRDARQQFVARLRELGWANREWYRATHEKDNATDLGRRLANYLEARPRHAEGRRRGPDLAPRRNRGPDLVRKRPKHWEGVWP